MVETVRAERLRKRQEFQAVFEQGRSLANKVAVVYFLRSGAEGCRLGVTVGRRLGTAVKRNRVKRRLREAVRCLPGRLASGWSIVLVGRRGAAEAAFPEVREAVASLLEKAGILTRPARD